MLISIRRKALRWTLLELFLLGADPMITILSGLELEVEISAFGIAGEERGVHLGGHLEVLIDLSTLSKFPVPAPVAQEHSRCWQYCSSLQKLAAYFLGCGSRYEASDAVTSASSSQGSCSPDQMRRIVRSGAETEIVLGIGSCPSLSINT